MVEVSISFVSASLVSSGEGGRREERKLERLACIQGVGGLRSKQFNSPVYYSCKLTLVSADFAVIRRSGDLWGSNSNQDPCMTNDVLDTLFSLRSRHR